MSKRDVKNISLMGLILLYVVLYKTFIFSHFMKYTELINASFMIIVLFLSILFLGFRKNKPNYLNRNIMNVVIIHLLITFLCMYVLGFSVGFLKNAYSLDLIKLLDNIFAPILLIVLVELFRYVFVWANKDKVIVVIIMAILLTIFEISISVRTIPFNDLVLLFKTTATLLLPITIKNCVLTYLCYHVGYKVPLVYRLVMDVYLFIVPLIPDLGDYLNSMILIALPILIYINSFNIVDERENRIVNVFKENNLSLSDIPLFVFIVILACLISGFFPHYMIGIGSSSMKPSVNRGDAVILKKIGKNDKLKKGQIIAFKKEGKVIVHRIEEIGKDEKGQVVYITKGDANNGVDSSPVTRKQVRGILRIKIPYIAFPTVWLNELMNGMG